MLILPNEILGLLPFFIDNLETFANAASSCRRLRDAFATTPASTILRLADASAPSFFSPHPHFLLAAAVRKAGDWARGDADRTRQLRQAFHGGIEGLHEFCLQHSGLTMEEVRRAHLARFSIINPLADKIDKMAGQQWSDTPDFWDGGVSEPNTIYTEASRAAFQIIIYGELFGSSMDAFLELQKPLPYFDITTRLDFVTYCLPDWGCRTYPGHAVMPVGPYATPERVLEGDQLAMRHILTCRRWRRMWTAAMREIQGYNEKLYDEYADEPWQQRLYRNALQVQGLLGMQLVTLPASEVSKACLEKARDIRRRINALQEPVEMSMGFHGSIPVTLPPDPAQEIDVCIQSMWLSPRVMEYVHSDESSVDLSDESSEDQEEEVE